MIRAKFVKFDQYEIFVFWNLWLQHKFLFSTPFFFQKPIESLDSVFYFTLIVSGVHNSSAVEHHTSQFLNGLKQ